MMLNLAHKGINILSKENSTCNSLSEYFDTLPNATCLPPKSDFAVKNSRKNICPPSLCFFIKSLNLSQENCCVRMGEEYTCLTCH